MLSVVYSLATLEINIYASQGTKSETIPTFEYLKDIDRIVVEFIEKIK